MIKATNGRVGYTQHALFVWNTVQAISRMSAQMFQEFISGEYPTEEEGLAQKRMWCKKYFQAKILIVSKQLDQMLISL